ncbi:MAG: phage holin family protein [Sphingomonadaceae bacterium]|nr:phage holin family protein [Sphingomonadaceae bacterium]
MLAPPNGKDGLGALVSRLLEEGRDLVRAEIDLGKAIALNRIARARLGLMMTGAAVLLVPSAITTLLVGCLLGLRPLVGPFAAGLIVSIATFCIAGLLGKLGVDRLIAAASGDDAKDGSKA